MKYTPPPSELLGLLASIRETPDDDAPRLVCADWFDDNGEPERAEFVRVQLERARLPWGDVRQAALMSRELRLLRRFAPAWTTGVHPLLKKCRFRRGFPEYAHLHLSHFLHHRRQLLSVAPIRDVSLTGFYRASEDLARRVAACEEWSNVEHLRIHHQGPHHAPDGRILPLLESPQLTRLKSLTLPGARFSADDRRRFERLDVLGRVEELSLPYLDRFPNDPGRWLSDGGGDWRRLRSLLLPDYLTDAEFAGFVSLPGWAGLTSLSLQTGYNVASHAAFARAVPPALRELTLHAAFRTHGESRLPDALIDALAAVPLESFAFSPEEVSADQLRRLLSPRSRWNLRRLSFNGTPTVDHLRAVAECPGAANLERLSLGFAGVTPVSPPPGLIRPTLRELEAFGYRFGELFPGDGAIYGLRGLSLGGRDATELIPTPELFPELVSLAVGDSYRGVIGRAAGFPLLASLTVEAGTFDAEERRQLARLGETHWVAAAESDVYDVREYRESRSPERRPPLDE